MKTVSLFIILAFSIAICAAQQGQVHIQQDQKIAQLLGIYKSVNENSSHFKIQVGFGNFQDAQKLKAEVEKDFPDWPSQIDFESPSYRVRLGKFKSQFEGERKLIEVRQKYPSAMLLKPEKTTN